MIERTLDSPRALLFPSFFLTRLRLVKKRVVLLLLPSMRVGTARLVRAPFDVLGDECPWLPVVAYLMALIFVDVGFPSEILPIVRINTLGFVVLLIEGAPLCLEVEHVEVTVLLHLMDQSSFKILGAMSERAVVTILTFA